MVTTATPNTSNPSTASSMHSPSSSDSTSTVTTTGTPNFTPPAAPAMGKSLPPPLSGNLHNIPPPFRSLQQQQSGIWVVQQPDSCEVRHSIPLHMQRCSFCLLLCGVLCIYSMQSCCIYNEPKLPGPFVCYCVAYTTGSPKCNPVAYTTCTSHPLDTSTPVDPPA